MTWETANGSFITSKTVTARIRLPEFHESATVTQTYHVCHQKIPYDVIIGRETLQQLGISLDFKNSQIIWNDSAVEMKQPKLLDNRSNLLQLANADEPRHCVQNSLRAERILDITSPAADIFAIVGNIQHLDQAQKEAFYSLLKEHEQLFDGNIGTWNAEPVHLELKPDATPYHGKPYPVTVKDKGNFKREIERLVSLGVLAKDSDSPWAAPSFCQPKKNKNEVRFLTDLRQLNKRLVRKPFLLPKISQILYEIDGMQWVTALDLKMGYYAIKLDPQAQKLCTLITPWGKYKYLRLPMGLSGAPDIFQEKIGSLVDHLEYARVYLDDLLVLTNGSFDDHLSKLGKVLELLSQAGLKCNADKCSFGAKEVEYLGYLLTWDGIRPVPAKIKSILALSPPKYVRQVRRLLGMIQYYRDLWKKRSHILAPLSNPVGKCGKTKAKKAKNKKFTWLPIHQEAFERIKQVIGKSVTLAYPDFNETFDIYTDSSDKQLGGVITQKGRPLAFYSRKLRGAQLNYTVTEKELLGVVETLKEF